MFLQCMVDSTGRCGSTGWAFLVSAMLPGTTPTRFPCRRCLEASSQSRARGGSKVVNTMRRCWNGAASRLKCLYAYGDAVARSWPYHVPVLATCFDGANHILSIQLPWLETTGGLLKFGLTII